MSAQENSDTLFGPKKARLHTGTRSLVSEFSSHLGRETLFIRIYRDGEFFIFERQIVERDGTSLVAVLAFKEFATLYSLLAADPYYERLKNKAAYISNSIENALKTIHGESTT